MKPVRIEFMEDRRWLWIWIPAALCCLGWLGGVVWQWKLKDQAAQETVERIHAVQTQLQILNAPAVVQADPRLGSTQLAAQLLQQDLNPVFAVVENLQVPGARLRGLALETASGTLRLEYELDSITTASQVTEALNMGYVQRPWHLDGVSGAAGGGNNVGSPPHALVAMGAPMFRGLWSVQLQRLQ